MLSALVARSLQSKSDSSSIAERVQKLTEEWFPEQRAFYDDPALLVAAIKGRRAGGTRGGCQHFVRLALQIPNARLLYLNSTRGEAERLAWYGLRDDGMASLIRRLKIGAHTNQAKLEIRLDNGSWIFLRGADDEMELRKALGFAYHEVWFDEAQKIPSKLAPSIREVLMPSLLDFKGRLRLVGTPVRQMAGLFYEVTHPDVSSRLEGWSVHHWTLLSNPFFGATEEERWKNGMEGLQTYYGGAKAAPMDSPIMQREGFGRWVHEDAAYTYFVHKIPRDSLFYAPHRLRPDGFVDVPAALADLPWPARDAFFSMGCDLGYNDPFAFTLWAWSAHDPKLYEVCSWRKSQLTSDEQVTCLRAVREHVAIGQIVSDAAAQKSTVRGWSKEWIERYGLPIVEAEKQHKMTAIATMNADILAGNIQLREGAPLYDEMSKIQWSAIVSGSGNLTEDPTIPNDTADSALYSHRHSYQYRWRPDEKLERANMTVEQRRAIEARELEQELEEDRDAWLH